MQLAAFHAAMRRLGWREGENLEIETLWTGGDNNKIKSLAKQIVETRPDVILARSTAAIKALQQETQSIPIVFVIVSDPVGDGFVDSMAQCPTLLWASSPVIRKVVQANTRKQIAGHRNIKSRCFFIRGALRWQSARGGTGLHGRYESLSQLQ